MNVTINATVQVKVGDKTYDVAVVNGKGSLNVSGLAYNTSYDVNVTFAGDTKYATATNGTTLTVNKIADYAINVTATNITYGQNATVTVVLPSDVNSTNLVIEVDGMNYAYTMVNGIATAVIPNLQPGEYEVNVTYKGDGKYSAKDKNGTKFRVTGTSVYDIKINVESHPYGEYSIINVTVPRDVENNVTITVDGVPYSVKANTTTGIATLRLNNLSGGLHAVIASYPGDMEYDARSNSTTFTVARASTTIDVKFTTPKFVGDNVIVNVELNQKVNGTVTLHVDNNNYTVYVKNGKGSYNIGDLINKTYSISASFAGDVNFTGSASAVKHLAVNKIPTNLTVTLSEAVIRVDGTSVVNIKLNQKINATVTVKVNGKEYTVSLTNGEGSLTLSDLANATYTINATFAETDKYLGNTSNTVTLKVNKISTSVDVSVDSPIVVGDDAIFKVTMNPGINATVKLIVGSKSYDVAVVNGKGNYTVSNLVKATYNVKAVFAGDDKYTGSSSATKQLVVNQVPTKLSIKLDKTPIIVGDKAVVSVELDKSITTAVTVKVNGENHVVGLVNGKGSLTLSDLTEGTYTINATYAGDTKYIGSTSNTVTLKVEGKTVTEMSVDIDVEKGIATVVLPDGVTGNVTVVIDGKVYNVTDITEIPVTIGIGDLKPGNHTVEVIYSGDKYFTPASKINDVEVPKVDDYKINVDTKVDGSSVDITVSLPKDVTGPVLIDVDGVGYYANATGGQATLHLDDLSKGEHNVVVKYPGDDYYAPNGNTTSFEIDAKETSMSIKVDDDEIVIELPEDATGNVTVSIDGKPQTVPVTGGRAVVDISGLEPGQHTVDVTYPGDDNYDPVSNSTSFEVPKVSDYPIDITEEDGKLVITVPDDATGSVTVSIDGKPQTVPVEDGKAVVDISGLEPGKHGVEVTYPGDDKYAPVSNATIVDIPKVVDYPFEVIAEDINVGQKTNITVNLPKDINGQVLVDIGGVGYYVTVTNGVAHIELPLDLKPGSYDAVVTFPGNDKYESKTVKDSFKVVDEKVPVDIKVEGDEIVVELPEDATGNVTVSINGKTQTVPVIDGKAVVNISDLEPGNYTVDVTYSGDDKYPSASNSTSFEVPKIVDYPIDISNTDDKFIVTVPEDATGDVKVTIDGKSYTVPIKDGKAVIDISDLPEGSHNFEVTYPGNDKYASKTVNGTIVKERYLIMTAPAVVKYYSGSERFIVYLTDNKGNKLSGLEVKITINGKTYTRTSENGEASIALNLISRNYTVKVDFDGNDEFKPQSINSTVEILPTIYAKDVLKVFKNGTHYYGLFLDGQGNPLANTEVNFNINGVFYTRTTNASGWAKLNINLPEGKYILTAINPVTSEMRTNNVTVFNLIESGDLVKYYKNGTQFIARIHSDDGGWVKAGVDVTFNINGVFYTRQTNETGHVKLNINLPPGDYIITAFYKNARKSNNVKVLSKLVTSDLNMKYHDGSKFVVKTLDGQGNPAPHQNVSFNINGILYSRMTNDVGEAGLNINLPSGKYIITSKYGEESKSNTITIGE